MKYKELSPEAQENARNINDDIIRAWEESVGEQNGTLDFEDYFDEFCMDIDFDETGRIIFE